MRSRVQVSLPLPTKNQALASTQVLFFYPFSGFTTKFPSPLQRIAAASVHCVPPTHLQKNSKKIAKNQPYASARHLCGSLWREPLKGASLGPLRELLEEPLLGASAGVVGGVSVQSLLESFWGASAGTFAGATKNPSSKDGFHTQTLTIQTMQWLNFLLFVSDTKVGQNASWDNRHN